jgi:c-di-GMP-binding flagellar brake protein YcgR
MSASSGEKIRQLKQKQKTWRRRFTRHRADFPLRATSLREDGYAEIRGRCGDIGRGGMGTVLTAEVAAGEVVSLEFRLPTFPQSFAIRAIVRYRRGFMHGLEFLGLSSDQELAINAFCANLEVVD